MGIVSGGGGGTFNGGTITAPLVVHPGASGATALTITQDTADTPFHATALHTYVDFDGDGSITFRSDDTLSAAFQGSGGTPASVAVQKLGVTLGRIDLDTAIGATVRGRPLFIVEDGGGTTVHTLAPTTLGFFGAAPTVKPAVAGAKLPSDVVLANLLTALVALGLITDNST